MAKMYFFSEGNMHWGKGGRRGEKPQRSIQHRWSAELSCYAFTPGVAGEGFADSRAREDSLIHRASPAAASRELTLRRLTSR